ncbi:MAG: hypothetical protein ACRD4K_14395 [Candidatus Acidiferrales bacterium]
MKFWKQMLFALLGGFLLCALAPRARADEWNKFTKLTFSAPVEIPGKVLPAGTYVFRLLDSPSDRNIVQIFNHDRSQLIATLMAIPDYRMTPRGKTVVKFSERAAGSPEAIKAWFYPGNLYGFQFVYPRQRALELAKASNEPVLAMPNELANNITEPANSSNEASVKEMKEAAVVGVKPNQEEIPMSQVVQSQPSENKEVAENRGAKLPQTASQIPLLALLGTLSLGIGLSIGKLSKGRA